MGACFTDLLLSLKPLWTRHVPTCLVASQELTQDVGFPHWFGRQSLCSEAFHGGLGPKEHAVKSNGLPPRLGNQGVN